MRPPSAIESLRVQVRQIEGRHRRATTALPFGVAAVDTRLPNGGLAQGALHEVAGGGNGAIDGAAAALFSAGIAARMRIESGDDRRAISSKGAMGLMQLMPETWGALRVRYGFGHDPFDPHDNVLAGAAFLREMHDRYGSPGFLAAYNAGPGRYEDYRDRRRPLPAETVAYVAALVPFVGGGGIDGPVLVAASDPPPWMRASLFITRSASVEPPDPSTPKPASKDAAAVIAVHDLSAIAPQSVGLFVVVSAARSKP